MNRRVTVIDYRAGNLTSVTKALRFLGATSEITDDPQVVANAERIVLPGVGHFSATRFLRERGISEAVIGCVRAGTPFLGICVGLQWLFEGSTEAMDERGLGFFRGICERFQNARKVPHVGWNSLAIEPRSRLLYGTPDSSYVYYTHSYRAPLHKDTVAVTDYGEPFTAAVELENVMGVQFHPEKSGETGLQILRNFLEWQPC